MVAEKKESDTSILKDEYRSDGERRSSIRTKSLVLLHPTSWETSSMYLESNRPLRHNGLFREDVAPSSPVGEGLVVSWLPTEV